MLLVLVLSILWTHAKMKANCVCVCREKYKKKIIKWPNCVISGFVVRTVRTCPVSQSVSLIIPSILLFHSAYKAVSEYSIYSYTHSVWITLPVERHFFLALVRRAHKIFAHSHEFVTWMRAKLLNKYYSALTYGIIYRVTMFVCVCVWR